MEKQPETRINPLLLCGTLFLVFGGMVFLDYLGLGSAVPLWHRIWLWVLLG